MRALVVEDNHDLAANLVDFLEAKGHAVDAAADGITGLHLCVANDYDVIVLDLVLPGLDGLTICRRLREDAGKTTPVLMLTARDSLDDKITGLEAGADDYVVKPFALREVEARIRALARRGTGAASKARLLAGDLSFDTATLTVSRAGKSIDLSPIPLRILELLMRAAPRLVRREEIERAIWGDAPPDSDALRAHMHILRTAIDRTAAKPLIRTVRGIGYRIADDDASAP
ncbi:MAG: response regulator transcription factor [Pseudomonadota bacterium]